MMKAKSHRSLGSARSGTHHWWHQRLTAIALVPLVLVFVAMLPAMAGLPHIEFTRFMADPFVAIVMVLVVTVGLWHMKLGVQVVIEDYIRGEGARFACQIALTLCTGLMIAAALVSILLIALK